MDMIKLTQDLIGAVQKTQGICDHGSKKGIIEHSYYDYDSDVGVYFEECGDCGAVHSDPDDEWEEV